MRPAEMGFALKKRRFVKVCANAARKRAKQTPRGVIVLGDGRVELGGSIGRGTGQQMRDHAAKAQTSRAFMDCDLPDKEGVRI